MSKTKELEFHPLCTIFPQASTEELEALGKDIKEKGLLEPIVLLDGKILEGRNRYVAATGAGVALTEDDFEEFLPGNGDGAESPWQDPVEFVISKNLRRRNLTPAQVAQCVVELVEFGKKGQRTPKKHMESRRHVSSISQIAKQSHVSRQAIKTAKRIKEKGAGEVVEAVKTGKVSSRAASKLVKLPKWEQRKVIARGPQAVATATSRAQQAKPTPATAPKTRPTAPDESHPVLEALDAHWEQCRGNWESHPAAIPRVVYQGLRGAVEKALLADEVAS